MLRSLASCVAALLLVAGAVQAQGTGNETPPLSGNRYGRQPWYGQPGVRQQLKLTDAQYERMNKAYGTSYSNFDTSVKAPGKLTEQQRQQLLQQGYSTFYKNLDTAHQEVLTPEQQTRYNQLWSQYRGYDAVLDPSNTQKLKLTEQQVQELRKLDAEYQQRMSKYTQQYGTNKDDAMKGYNELQPQVNVGINRILTAEQRQQWGTITGGQYQFQPFYGYTK